MKRACEACSSRQTFVILIILQSEAIVIICFSDSNNMKNNVSIFQDENITNIVNHLKNSSEAKVLLNSMSTRLLCACP